MTKPLAAVTSLVLASSAATLPPALGMSGAGHGISCGAVGASTTARLNLSVQVADSAATVRGYVTLSLMPALGQSQVELTTSSGTAVCTSAIPHYQVWLGEIPVASHLRVRSATPVDLTVRTSTRQILRRSYEARTAQDTVVWEVSR